VHESIEVVDLGTGYAILGHQFRTVDCCTLSCSCYCTSIPGSEGLGGKQTDESLSAEARIRPLGLGTVLDVNLEECTRRVGVELPR
jgi:hypothetical protein